MSRDSRVAGEVEFAAFASNSPPFNNERLTKTQKEGLRYEKRAISYLSEEVKKRGGWSLLPSPWIMFRSKSHQHPRSISFCQPDSLLLHEEERKAIIVEVKLSHTPFSWKQLRLLYEPVIRRLYPSFHISLVELCKWYDPHIAYPEHFVHAGDVFAAPEGCCSLHIYKPRGRAKRAEFSGGMQSRTGSN